MSIKKIMFFPGLVLEDFLLNRDIGYELGNSGYQVIIFEENANYLADKQNKMEDFILKNRPDLFISYNLSAFNIRKQKGLVSIPLIEDLEIPYVSLNFGPLWDVAIRYLSAYKFMKYLKAVSFICPNYVSAAAAFGFKNINLVPISMGYLRPIKIHRPKIKNKCLIWQAHVSLGRKTTGSSELYNRYILKVESSLPQRIDTVRKMLPEEIIGSILEGKFMEDVEYRHREKALKSMKKIIKKMAIEYDSIALGFPSFKSLADTVQSVPLVLYLPSIFNDLGWDSTYWQIWKSGGVSILPRVGVWKELELAIDLKDKKHFAYVVELLMKNAKEREKYREEVLSIIEEEFSWKKNLLKLFNSLDGLA